MPDATSPWAAPGAEPLRALSPATVAPTVATERRSELLPPPVDFGPMTVADVLDGAFEIIKRRPGEIALVAAIAILPLQVVLAVVFRDYFSSDMFSLDIDSETSLGSESSAGAQFLVQGAIAMSLALMCGAVSSIVADWYRGVRRSVADTLKLTARCAPALVGGVVVVKLIEGVGFLALVVGALVAMAGLHVVSPVIALETRNPLRAVARSLRLTASSPGRSLVVPVLAAVVGTVVSLVLLLLADFLAELTPIEYAWIVVGAGQLISNMIVLPFTAGVAALYYVDLRVRREGLDLEEKARVVFGS